MNLLVAGMFGTINVTVCHLELESKGGMFGATPILSLGTARDEKCHRT